MLLSLTIIKTFLTWCLHCCSCSGNIIRCRFFYLSNSNNKNIWIYYMPYIICLASMMYRCINVVTMWTNLWYNHRMIFYKTSCNWECFCIYFEISDVYYSFYIFQVSYLYTEKSLMLLNDKWNSIIIKRLIFNDSIFSWK